MFVYTFCILCLLKMGVNSFKRTNFALIQMRSNDFSSNAFE